MQTRPLRATLESLAQSFASAVLEVVRSASLDELRGETRIAPRHRPARPGRPRATRAAPSLSQPPAPASVGKARGGRLARRSSEDVEKTLGLVLAAVKTNGMRAEELQRFLSLDRRELPRVLALGLSKKVLRRSGQKRATVYSAA